MPIRDAVFAKLPVSEPAPRGQKQGARLAATAGTDLTAVAVASCSQLAADAGARVARLGGNAVDAGIATALVTISTQPGVCSVGCGGFVTVSAPDQSSVTIDGNVSFPGRGARTG